MRTITPDEEDKLNVIKINNMEWREIPWEISFPWQKDYKILLGISINDVEYKVSLNVYSLLTFHLNNSKRVKKA